MTRTNKYRATAEYAGGSRVRFTWPCGHGRIETLYIGPKQRRKIGAPQNRPGKYQRPMDPEAVKRLAHYWRDGVSIHPCPTCGGPRGISGRTRQ